MAMRRGSWTGDDPQMTDALCEGHRSQPQTDCQPLLPGPAEERWAPLVQVVHGQALLSSQRQAWPSPPAWVCSSVQIQ